VLLVDSSCMHAVATTPVGPAGLVALPIGDFLQPTAAFPVIQAGRLPHYPFRGLLSVHSRYGLHTR
jgi:hypothetical protein